MRDILSHGREGRGSQPEFGHVACPLPAVGEPTVEQVGYGDVFGILVFETGEFDVAVIFRAIVGLIELQEGGVVMVVG